MVQLKYFGDDRDFFKYDLITFILKNSGLNNYVFIPMLTEHRDDNEGNKPAYHKGDKDSELLQFMQGCPTKSLKHWERWLSSFADRYLTVEPVDELFFYDETRSAYWKKFASIIGTPNALIFVDPDTGLETGTPSYQKRMGRDKYLLNEELAQLVASMDESSVLMIYQHLPRNRNIHIESMRKKIKQASEAVGGLPVCAFREDDLAFLFIAKSRQLYDRLLKTLKKYDEKNNSRSKTLLSQALKESIPVKTPSSGEEIKKNGVLDEASESQLQERSGTSSQPVSSRKQSEKWKWALARIWLWLLLLPPKTWMLCAILFPIPLGWIITYIVIHSTYDWLHLPQSWHGPIEDRLAIILSTLLSFSLLSG